MLGFINLSSICEVDFDYYVGIMSDFKSQQMSMGNSSIMVKSTPDLTTEGLLTERLGTFSDQS